MKGEPWIDAINRLLRAEDRIDPWDRDGTKLKRWNQGDLAEAAGIRPNTLSEILQGRREPSIETLSKITTAFKVPLWMMFVSERQAAVLRDQQANDELHSRRVTLAEEVRTLVAQALEPIADRLTAAAVEKLAPPDRPAAAAAKRKRKSA